MVNGIIESKRENTKKVFPFLGLLLYSFVNLQSCRVEVIYIYETHAQLRPHTEKI